MGNCFGDRRYFPCFDRSEASLARSRVLVTGATGLLGRQVMRVFGEHGWTVRGLGFSRAEGAVVKCDLFDRLQLAAQFDDFRPDIVIHCAAERRPDKLEEDKAYALRINVDVARSVGELSRKNGAWPIYMSTNYVFDGKAAPYSEDAEPSPLSVYGESKLAGEKAILEAHPLAAILRVPLLYGPIEKVEETSVTALLKTIKEESPRLDNWQERYPTNTEDLAEVLEAMAESYATCSRPSDFGGVFHWQASERHTKYTMATAIAEIAGLPTAHLVAVDDPPLPGSAPRPQFERMLCSRLEKLLGIEGQPGRFRSSFRDSLRRHLAHFV